MRASVGNFPRREMKHSFLYYASHFRGGVIFLVWPLGSPLLGKSNSVPSPQGCWKGDLLEESSWVGRREALLPWASSLWPLLVRESALQGEISISNYTETAYRVLHLLVDKTKLWMRQNSTFRKEEDAVLAAQSLVKFEHPLLFSLQHDVTICFVQA